MSIKQLIARSVLLSVLANPAHAAVVSSTFDASAEGWIGIPGEGSVAFFSSGGNPGGHIRVTDIGGGGVLGSGAIAPSKFLGNLSGFNNGMLSVDLATFAGGGGTFSTFGRVQISGAGATVFCDLATTAPPFGTWQTFSAPLTAAKCGTTSLQLMTILADVTEIAIGTDAFDGADTIGIDNFTILAEAQGVLENPPSGSFQSGIGVVSGWKCSAGIITARFDGFIDVQASYGTARGDTRAVCNDDGNNGFGILVNWNNLGPGVHTVEILDNGQFFASATVTVTTFGTDFLSGVSGTCTVTNFPSPGRNTTLEWQQSSQNFAIRGVTGGGGGGLTQ